MIRIQNLWKTYRFGSSSKIICRNVNLDFPSGVSVGLLGRNGAGKSTLLRLLAGVESPDSGMINSDGAISWPVGFAGSFHPELTGAQNIMFVGRVYGADTDDLLDFVNEFADLGAHFHAPFRTYSAGMRSRLAFGLSMGIKFDTYLIDEVTSVGDAAFKARSAEMLENRLETSGAIIVSHDMQLIRRLCQKGVVVAEGNMRMFDSIEEAIQNHEAVMKGVIPEWASS